MNEAERTDIQSTGNVHGDPIYTEHPRIPYTNALDVEQIESGAFEFTSHYSYHGEGDSTALCTRPSTKFDVLVIEQFGFD